MTINCVLVKNKIMAKSKGLGDTIHKVTKATGIHSAVQKVSKAIGKPCGCAERRDSLNRKFPYSKPQ